MFHITDSSNLQLKEYSWKQSPYGSSSFPYHHNHVYGSIFNPDINDVGWFCSNESSGKITITRFDTVAHIISGTFSGKLKARNGTKELPITDGRFDINWITVANKKFL